MYVTAISIVSPLNQINCTEPVIEYRPFPPVFHKFFVEMLGKHLLLTCTHRIPLERILKEIPTVELSIY